MNPQYYMYIYSLIGDNGWFPDESEQTLMASSLLTAERFFPLVPLSTDIGNETKG
jgi:hypothetical protein